MPDDEWIWRDWYQPIWPDWYLDVDLPIDLWPTGKGLERDG